MSSDDKLTNPIKVNNLLVWILAFAPIIGEFLRGIIIFVMYGDGYQAMFAIANDELWFITLILNIALGIADEKYLKRIGIDTSNFKMWSAFVPVYLFQRARILNHSYAYFIAWCVSFVLIMLF
ncbi:hypothetical protein BMT54_06880 [Pasteurellaceae bacterium 15-036681]|nr:hypothetical protein BMT54_06880 [Pasteurellaceae bacterium 15-036681]